MSEQSHATSKTLYYGWIILGTSCLMTMLSQGIQGSFGNFLKPISTEFGWDRATASLPVALSILMTGIFQPFVGRIVDRQGPRRVITFSVCLLAVSVAAIALTPGLWYFMGVYGVVFALAVSGAGTIPNATLAARWFVHKRGKAMSLVSAGGSVGQLLIIPLSMLILLRTNWRTTYLILGGLVLCICVPAALFLLRNSPEELGLQPDGAAAPPTETSETPAHPRAAPHALLEPPEWYGAFVSSPFWLLIGSFFVCGFTVQMISTHFVAFVTDRGISPGVAATALGLLSGCNLVGTLLAGIVSDRIGRKNPLALIYLVRGVAFAFLLMVDTPWMLYLFAIVGGLSWFSSVPLTIALTGEMYGNRHMGTLVGLVFTSHQIGGALSSYMAGRLFDLTGSYTLMFGIAIVLLIGAGVASAAIQERRYSLKYQTANAL